jgi:hypothetical protein
VEHDERPRVRTGTPVATGAGAIRDSLHRVYANWADEPLHGNRRLPERVHLLGDVGWNAGDRDIGKTRAHDFCLDRVQRPRERRRVTGAQASAGQRLRSASRVEARSLPFVAA